MYMYVVCSCVCVMHASVSVFYERAVSERVKQAVGEWQ